MEFTMTQSVYFEQHARDCGINMTGKVAIPLGDSAGRLVMIDIIDPVTRDVVIHAGTTMDAQLIEVCESYGIDYVVAYRWKHTAHPALSAI
jgi:hypothetical protein